MIIEAAELSRDRAAHLYPFGEALSSDKTDRLRESLREGFLLSCAAAPELARDYLKFKMDHSKRGVRDIERIVDQPGMLARAAPKELAELTKRSLVNEPENRGRHGSPLYDRGFSFLDSRFLNKSPTRGPFLKLLQNDFDTGLSLITDLAIHAAEQFPGFGDQADEALVVEMSGTKFTFPYPATYVWSRQASGYYSLTCALMALELWGHHQIEAGATVKEVVEKILWRDGIPAAFLLVAVDLVLCHFEHAAETAMDLIASPELLVLDHSRWAQERFVTYNFFPGSGGAIQDCRALIDLKSRPSRDRTLVDILGQFVLGVHNSYREALSNRLESLAVNYPDYGPEAARGDPSYMVRHAINQLAPENWRNNEIVLDGGRRASGFVYVSPEPEASHIGRLQAELVASQAEQRMPFELTIYVDEPSRSSRELAERAIKWADGRAPDLSSDDLDNERFKDFALIAAAVIALRDGEENLWRDNEGWIRETLEAAARQPDKGYMSGTGMSYEPAAMAFAGFAYLWLADRVEDDLEAVLGLAALRRAAVRGYKAVGASLFEAEPRLAKSLLRTGLHGCIRPRKDWESSDDEWNKTKSEHEGLLFAHVSAERLWLISGGEEPPWPELPKIGSKERKTIRVSSTDQPPDTTPETTPANHFFDHECASGWFPPRGLSVKWYGEFWGIYKEWTLIANGAEGAWNVDSNSEILSWNYAWAHGAVDWLVSNQPHRLTSELIEPLRRLPDSPFLRMASLTFPYLVEAFISGRLPKKVAVDVHQTFLERLEQTSAWQSLLVRDRNSSEADLGAALACLFFNIKPLGQTPQSFVGPDEVETVDPLVPALEQFVSANGTIATALNVCILIERKPRRAHLQMTFNLLDDLIKRKGNDHEFWIEFGFGRRFCKYWTALNGDDRNSLAAGSPDRTQLDHFLASLVSFGVPEASQLEVELARRDE
ncbi:hypothetical protein GC173_15680 [bacterium]|nr:hypothetical protein [bacterium]